jgi:hypothetical protein
MSGINLKEVPHPEFGKAAGSEKPAPAEGTANGYEPDVIARETARQLDYIALAWSLRS